MLGISGKDPRLAGRAMVATPLPMLPPWRTPSGSGRSGRSARDRRRREQGKPTYFDGAATPRPPAGCRRSHRAHCTPRPRRDGRELTELEALEFAEEAQVPLISAPPPAAAEAEEPVGEGHSLARSGVIFAIATALSRVLGLLREIVAAYLFGIRGPINAFNIAFLIPNTVRSLVADQALSGAFVPVFSELLVKGERKRAWRVASSIFWLMLLGLGGLTALFIVLAPWVMGLFNYGPNDLYGPLAIALSRILFPTVVILGLTGVVVGILNSYDHFTVPAFSPVAWNLVILLGRARGGAHDLLSTAHEALLLRRLDPDRDDRPVPTALAVAARA